VICNEAYALKELYSCSLRFPSKAELNIKQLFGSLDAVELSGMNSSFEKNPFEVLIQCPESDFRNAKEIIFAT